MQVSKLGSNSWSLKNEEKNEKLYYLEKSKGSGKQKNKIKVFHLVFLSFLLHTLFLKFCSARKRSLHLITLVCNFQQIFYVSCIRGLQVAQIEEPNLPQYQVVKKEQSLSIPEGKQKMYQNIIYLPICDVENTKRSEKSLHP